MMSPKKNAMALIVLVALECHNTALAAEPSIAPGHCAAARYQELFEDSEKFSAYLFMVAKEGAELHRSNRAPGSFGGGSGQIEAQSLHTMLRPVDVDGHWLQVSRYFDPIGSAYGWIRKSDLLCTKTPLVANDGPELVFYIKTTTSPRDDPEVVSVYDHSSGGKEIAKPSRFDSYFIMDEQNGRYLLSKNYYVDDSTRLVGWIDKASGFIWNSAFGLRPAENMEEEALFAYAKDDRQKQFPIPILGGKHWYKIGLRIPALKQQNDTYQVILPLSGTGACVYKDGNKVVCPKGLKTPGQLGLGELRQLDVLFLIDGTSSMQNYINAAKKTAQNLIRQMTRDERFRKHKFRFAYRIYRDFYAGKKEFESLPFGKIENSNGQLIPVDDCSKPRTEENITTFEKSLGRVKVTSDDHDDFAENLYGGLKLALRDLRQSCLNNNKILFVIGDTSYDAEAQRSRKRTPVSIDQLRNTLLGAGGDTSSVLTFFLQIEFDEKYRDNEIYNKVYGDYFKQGRSVVRTVLDAYEKQLQSHQGLDASIDPNRFLLKINDSNLFAKVKSGFEAFLGGDNTIGTIETRLDGGEALVDIIKDLQGEGIPAVFFGQVLEKLCKSLGKLCTNGIHDSTLEGTLTATQDQLNMDVWFTSRSLERYIQILSSLQQIKGDQDLDLRRRKLVNTLSKVLEAQIKKPTYAECRGRDGRFKECTLAEYLSTYGHLPVRENSPLLRYKISDLDNPDTVPNCEIDALLRWIKSSHDLLVVAQGNRKPVWKEGNSPECRRTDGSYVQHDIPYIPPGGISGELFKDDDNTIDEDMKYSHRQDEGLDLYWIPHDFLP